MVMRCQVERRLRMASGASIWMEVPVSLSIAWIDASIARDGRAAALPCGRSVQQRGAHLSTATGHGRVWAFFRSSFCGPEDETSALLEMSNV